MTPEDLTKTAGAAGGGPTTQTTNMSMVNNQFGVPKVPGYATTATKDGVASTGSMIGEDTYSGAVNLKKTSLTGIRSAGFFSRTQGTTNIGGTTTNHTEGTFRYRETAKNAKEEFASRKSLQNRRSVANTTRTGGANMNAQYSSHQSSAYRH